MPSWHDGSSSSQSLLGDLCAADYAPDRCDDPNFYGIAVGCDVRCQGHNMEPQRCVAFEGTNTGRRFYMCPIQNEVVNCGFVSWVDDQEWPQTLQNALSKLWSMYHDSNNASIDEGVEHGKLLAIAAEQKTKAETKYASLMADVGRFLDDSQKKVMQQNMAILKGADVDVVEMEKERDALKTAVDILKQVQRTQAEVMKAKEQKWDEERKALKEEKRATEQHLLDLLKANSCNMEKVNRIKAIVNE